MTDARTKIVKSQRQRRRKRGLQRIEVQVPASEVAVIRRAAAILRSPTMDAAHLRRHLGFETGPGFETEPGNPLTVLSIFAMPQPISAAGEDLWDQAMRQVKRDRRDPRFNRLRDVDL